MTIESPKVIEPAETATHEAISAGAALATSPAGESDYLVTRQMAADVRGPWMTRIGLVLVVVVASVGLVLNVWSDRPGRNWGIAFYTTELSIELAVLSVSLTKWFARNWEAIVLANCCVVIAGIAIVSIGVGSMATGVMGIVLLQVGASAFMPWHPTRQMLLNCAAVIGVAVFTLFIGQLDIGVTAYWIVVITSAVIGQVACTASYRYRNELERHVESVIEGRRKLAVEIREHERVIAQLRDAQAELVKSREEALAASRAKSEFLSTMSHEIRTPMNSVLGMAELLDDARLDAEQRRHLGVIRTSGSLLLELINSILDLARLESGRPAVIAREFSLRATIDEVIATVAVSARDKSIELVTRLAPGLPERLVGDSLRLRQVLTNLIGNAIKFTERGQVILEVERNRDSNEPGDLLFSVTDTGIGVAADKLESIFASFTQADSSHTRKYGGTGLGLAIAQRLIGLIGGRIWVESKLADGSKFSFTARFGVASPRTVAPGRARNHRGERQTEELRELPIP